MFPTNYSTTILRAHDTEIISDQYKQETNRRRSDLPSTNDAPLIPLPPIPNLLPRAQTLPPLLLPIPFGRLELTDTKNSPLIPLSSLFRSDRDTGDGYSDHTESFQGDGDGSEVGRSSLQEEESWGEDRGGHGGSFETSFDVVSEGPVERQNRRDEAKDRDTSASGFFPQVMVKNGDLLVGVFFGPGSLLRSPQKPQTIL